MNESTERDRYDWGLPLYAVAGASLAFVPQIFDADLGLLVALVALPLVGLLLFIVAVRKKGQRVESILTTLAIYLALSWVLNENSVDVRATSRWLVRSQTYKAEVLGRPASALGDFRHLEWDGWGFVGQDNSVYLVFDPTDSLAPAARSTRPGKFRGIPCEVVRVYRLESHYYSVRFYTNTDWDHCDSGE